MSAVFVQNNVFAGAKAQIEGRIMEFASEADADEYKEEHEDDSSISLYRRMEFRSLMRGNDRTRRN